MMFDADGWSHEAEPVAEGRAVSHTPVPRPLLRPARGATELPAWILRARGAPRGPVVVAVHGIQREARSMARELAARAARLGRVVIAPEFSKADFPRYQRACCSRRADLALLRLLDDLKAEGVIPPGPVDLAGYSGGAQFAHRFAWLHPARVGRLTLVSAGWYTFPDAAPFPYGLGPGGEGPRDAARWFSANLPAFLDRDIAVRVGARDDVADPLTRSGAAIDAQQGRDRLSRGRAWTEAINAAAARLGLAPRARFAALPGAGHDLRDCLRIGGADRAILPGGACERR